MTDLRYPHYALLLVLLSALIQPLQADTVYVIDKLLVGVHKDKNLDSPIIKVFPTGTKLEILQRDDELARIRGPEDITGWVDSSYLTSKIPAQLRLEAVEAELTELKANIPREASVLEEENERLRQQAASERLKVAELQAQLSSVIKDQSASGAADKNRLAELQTENHRLQSALEEEQAEEQLAYSRFLNAALSDQHLWYYLAAIVLLAVLGFFCGMQFMDWIQRRRHGGFRI